MEHQQRLVSMGQLRQQVDHLVTGEGSGNGDPLPEGRDVRRVGTQQTGHLVGRKSVTAIHHLHRPALRQNGRERHHRFRSGIRGQKKTEAT